MAMMTNAKSGLLALCTFGMSSAESEQLMAKYGNVDEVPLNEFDATEYGKVKKE